MLRRPLEHKAAGCEWQTAAATAAAVCAEPGPSFSAVWISATLVRLSRGAACRPDSPHLAFSLTHVFERDSSLAQDLGTDVADGYAVGAYLQAEMARRGVDEVSAVEAAQWLDRAHLLRDSNSRPGLALRDLLRSGVIVGAQQRPSGPHGRWYIARLDSSSHRPGSRIEKGRSTVYVFGELEPRELALFSADEIRVDRSHKLGATVEVIGHGIGYWSPDKTTAKAFATRDEGEITRSRTTILVTALRFAGVMPDQAQIARHRYAETAWLRESPVSGMPGMLIRCLPRKSPDRTTASRGPAVAKGAPHARTTPLLRARLRRRRLEEMLDADCDLRLSRLWQSAFEHEVFDGMSDTVLDLFAILLCQAYTAGYDDRMDNQNEPCLVSCHWTESWVRPPAHDRL